MSTVVKHHVTLSGEKYSLCPRCRVQWVYWDPEDLDENGDLRCYCEEDERAAAEGS